MYRAGPPAVPGAGCGRQAVGGLRVGGEAVGGQAVGGQAVGGQAVGGQTVGGQTVGGLRVGGEAVGGLTVGGLTVARAARRIFEEPSPLAADPKLRRYLEDMVRPYGVTLRDEPFEHGCGQSYGEMAAALLAELTTADEPVDLLACAFTVGDVIPGRSTAAYLSDQCPGAPSGFAVCDQGIAAPYTALRLMTAYQATANCQRCVLVVTEQAAQHYDLPVPAAMPSVHAAVTLLLTGPAAPFSGRPAAAPPSGRPAAAPPSGRPAAAPPSGRPAPPPPSGRPAAAGPSSDRVAAGAVGMGAMTRLRAGVAESALPDLLASELSVLSAGRDEVTLITGGGLNSRRQGSWRPPAGWEVLAAPAGQPCTGTWWELAGCLGKWQGSGRRVLLADYDPQLRYLGAFGVDVR